MSEEASDHLPSWSDQRKIKAESKRSFYRQRKKMKGAKPAKVQAKFSLVDKADKQPAVILFEVLGEMYCNAIHAPSKKHQKFGFVYVGKWMFTNEDFKNFGYTPKNGQVVNVLVKRIEGSANQVKIVQRHAHQTSMAQSTLARACN